MKKQKGSPRGEAKCRTVPGEVPHRLVQDEAGLPAIPMLSGRQLQAGQTLIETLLAFSVAVLVLSAIVVGISTSLSNTQYTKNQNLANSYAQEGMAVVRGIRDSSWPKFFSYTTNATYCLAQNSIILTDPPLALNCGQNVGIFSREVKFEHASQSCIADPACLGPACLKGSKVTVKVSWSDNKCPVGTPLCHKVELVTCFSNIDQKQAP